MTPLDKYLKQVRPLLPADQADDIIEELSENLREQLDDRESEFGRPLTENEQQAILDAHGNPLVVAAGYQPDQDLLVFGKRQLIGPALFPAYLRVLRINLVVTVFIVIGVSIALVAGVGQSIGSAMGTIALAILIQLVAVTSIFAAAQRIDLDDPAVLSSGLEAAVGQRATTVSAPSLLDRISSASIGADYATHVPRWVSAAELALFAAALAWLIIVRPPLVFDPFRSGPGWDDFWLPLIALDLFGAIGPAVNLVRPRWLRFRSVIRMLFNVALAAVLALSLSVRDWVVLVDPASATDEELRLVAEFDRWIGVAVTIGIGIAVAYALLELRRLIIVWRRDASRPVSRPA